jgi:hypothetical protein
MPATPRRQAPSTPSKAEAAPRVKLALWGDSRENLDQACEQIASVLLNDITDWDVQVHCGDFTHRGAEEDWQRTLHYKGIDRLFVKGRFLMTTSNHDCDESKTPNCRAVYDKYTQGVLPKNDLDHTTHFFGWDRGNVHIVFCDPYFTDAAVMNKWLDAYVKKIPAGDWLIGVWHQPAYDFTYKESFLPTCKPWLDALFSHGAKFVFNGHAHMYVRTKAMLPDGTLDEKGIVHIINGTGGASWKDPAKPNERIAFTPAVTSFPCITFLTFEGNKATLSTVDARPSSQLKVIDTSTWTR